MYNIASYTTGNEFISLDNINIKDASIQNLTTLHMQSKGLLDFRGEKDPLFKVNLSADGENIEFKNIKWTLIDYWILQANIKTDEEIIEITILTPLMKKGFAYDVLIKNNTNKTKIYDINFNGRLDSLYHLVNEEKNFDGKFEAYHSNWSNGPVFSISNGFPTIALSPLILEDTKWTYTKEKPLTYQSSTKLTIKANQKDNLTCFWGVGYEEVSSITAAIDMKRTTFNFLLEEMRTYLKSIIITTKNEKFNNLLNRNLLFNLFYSTGITIDSEERVCVTSRSPKYYVSAAYWDRDSLLWSFPAIVNSDKKVAKEIIDYITTKQHKNIGIHSRFIDGSVLEPGFELDELCSFIIALDYYIINSLDYNILKDNKVINLINKILNILDTKKSNSLNLYQTFLQPTDDMRVYPYLTYNNVLVWKVFKILEKWNFNNKGESFYKKAKNVYDAINSHCIKIIKGKNQFIWSIDENGNWDIYDEPPGSLILLPVFDFISKDNEIYRNTVSTILDESYKYSFKNTPFGAIGCPHAPHPWILSLANSVRVFQDEDALNKLIMAEMDNGLACESIDEYTGICTTGRAFATCAGYLSFTLLSQVSKFK